MPLSLPLPSAVADETSAATLGEALRAQEAAIAEHGLTQTPRECRARLDAFRGLLGSLSMALPSPWWKAAAAQAVKVAQRRFGAARLVTQYLKGVPTGALPFSRVSRQRSALGTVGLILADESALRALLYIPALLAAGNRLVILVPPGSPHGEALGRLAGSHLSLDTFAVLPASASAIDGLSTHRLGHLVVAGEADVCHHVAREAHGTGTPATAMVCRETVLVALPGAKIVSKLPLYLGPRARLLVAADAMQPVIANRMVQGASGAVVPYRDEVSLRQSLAVGRDIDHLVIFRGQADERFVEMTDQIAAPERLSIKGDTLDEVAQHALSRIAVSPPLSVPAPDSQAAHDLFTRSETERTLPGYPRDDWRSKFLRWRAKVSGRV